MKKAIGSEGHFKSFPDGSLSKESWHPVPSLHGKSMGNDRTLRDLFSWTPKSLHMVTAAMKLKDACSWEKSHDKPRQCIKKQRHCPFSQSYGVSSSHL